MAETSPQKLAARRAVNLAVRGGSIPKPAALPCVDCGHIWTGKGNRHEYDHHLGYEPAHHLKIQPVCKACHVARDNARAKQTHCIHGHPYTPENTGRKSNGTRFCRECRRMREKNKKTAEWWRDRRARKKNG